MLNIPNYKIVDCIYETEYSVVYKAYYAKNKSVILKTANTDYPTVQALTRYQQEFNITHYLHDVTGVIQMYAIEKYQNRPVLILEDFGGKSLKYWLGNHKFDIKRLLDLAIRMTQILGDVHHRQVIHKDINPSNFVWNPDTDVLKLIDFGISSRLSHETTMFENPDNLEGTLAYIAPEQTGRMNRLLDYRADFYSLGVTFYEMFLGYLPFEYDDPMELVHAHIAKTAQTLQISEIFKASDFLSRIIEKLMAKNAEDRYQSAYGLQWDLERMVELSQTEVLSETTSVLEGFQLGTHDVSERFEIPQKLYGRSAEVQKLIQAFERVATPLRGNMTAPSSGKSELFIVTGYSGVGKSSLIHEIHRPTTEKHGFFIEGKFDQFQRNIPYVAFSDAFDQFCEYLLTGDEKSLSSWKRRILKTIGNNGQVLIDIIPNLAWIIGEQPPVAELGAQETQNRFNLYFQFFIQTIATADHPLVMFIDDLQWADMASLNLLKLIFTNPKIQHVLLIGAYRNNEVSSGHPLLTTINEIIDQDMPVTRLELANLQEADLATLIGDTLNCSPVACAELTNLVYQKTYGNPFFVRQFLHTLYHRRLLTFEYSPGERAVTHGWSWDIEQIDRQNITTNVVELMANTIGDLAGPVQTMMQIAACIGNSFDLQTVAMTLEQSPLAVIEQARQAIASGLILASNKHYLVVQAGDDSAAKESEFHFVHDRVQQAAYQMLEESKRQQIHLKIGRLMLQRAEVSGTSALLEEPIFDIANHLNLGQAFITAEFEKIELAQLNYLASVKARQGAAYQSAYAFSDHGLKLLDETAWQTNYELMYGLHAEAIEAAFLSGATKEIDILIETTLSHARNSLDKAHIYRLKVTWLTPQKELQAALNHGLEALQLLDVHFPTKASQGHVVLALLRIKMMLFRKNMDDLKHLPVHNDPKIRFVYQLLTQLTAAVYSTSPELMALTMLKQVELMLKHGHTIETPGVGLGYALILIGGLNDIEGAFAISEFCFDMFKKIESPRFYARARHFFDAAIRHWRFHVRESIPALSETSQLCLEQGELEFGASSLFQKDLLAFFCGNDLSQLVTIQQDDLDTIKNLKQELILDIAGTTYEACLNMLTLSETPYLLQGERYDERVKIPHHEVESNQTALYLVYEKKTLLAYWFGYDEQAWTYFQGMAKNIGSVAAMYSNAIFHLYGVLIRVAIYPQATRWEKIKHQQKIYGHLRQMKFWAKHAPMNYLHKYYLMRAESRRVFGDGVKAHDDYNQAISLAKEHEFWNELALAWELAGKFYLGRGQTSQAHLYLRQAHQAYQQWGALAKVADIENNYPDMLVEYRSVSTSKGATHTKHHSLTTSSQTAKHGSLDLNSIMKASQALSSEIVLDKLLQKLMRVVIENAGAEKGVLLLPHQNGWFIQAIGQVNQKEVHVLQNLSVQDNHHASVMMVMYVARAHESVVLHNAPQSKKFAHDPYVMKHKPKSVLCMPLMKGRVLKGILYLENNLVSGTFTANRLDLLEMFAAQIAISIENAKLYAESMQLSAMQRELAIAHQIQASLLPPPRPDWKNLTAVCYSTPAKEIGGDFYAYYGEVNDQVLEGKYVVAVGDLTGKGVSAALLMATSLSRLDAVMDLKMSLVERMTYLDKALMPYTKPQRQNCALCLLEFADVNTEHPFMRAANAAGIPPYIRRVNGKVNLLDIGGFALGQGLGTMVGYQDEQINLSKGDMVILVSDGVIEAMNVDREMFGFDRMQAIVESFECQELSGFENLPEMMVAHVKRAVMTFVGEAEQHDDLTIVVVEV